MPVDFIQSYRNAVIITFAEIEFLVLLVILLTMIKKNNPGKDNMVAFAQRHFRMNFIDEIFLAGKHIIQLGWAWPDPNRVLLNTFCTRNKSFVDIDQQYDIMDLTVLCR